MPNTYVSDDPPASGQAATSSEKVTDKICSTLNITLVDLESALIRTNRIIGGEASSAKEPAKGEPRNLFERLYFISEQSELLRSKVQQMNEMLDAMERL